MTPKEQKPQSNTANKGMKYNFTVKRSSEPGKLPELLINDKPSDLIEAISCLYEMVNDLQPSDQEANTGSSKAPSTSTPQSNKEIRHE